MASTPVNYDQNEYEFVGALQDGVPTEITKADTAEHLYVPAHAEVILEGYIMPRVRTAKVRLASSLALIPAPGISARSR